MSNPQLSLDLFNQAMAMKRAGKFLEAIELQKKSIQAYPEDPDLAENFYAMGKLYYLAHKYNHSIIAYKVFHNMCVLTNIEYLDDYKRFTQGDAGMGEELYRDFYNLAHNLGHAMLDPKEKNKPNEILWYRYTVMGKRPQEVPGLAQYHDSYEEYDSECVSAGMRGISLWFRGFIQDFERAKEDYDKAMETLIYY